ncbi:MAG: hypothetical protein JWN00_2516 [Actinomycetia bacterium]|jgi:hypothetical protein|nr:hypothetical protein [Actinomycetes bacterium]
MVEGILEWIGGATLPTGDSGKTRQAAGIWRQLAKDIDSSIKTTGPVAADVWNKNSGDQIDAFQTFWTKDLAPYPEELVAYCNRVADVCDAYAKLLDDVTEAMILIALTTWAGILITLAWGWVTGYSEILAERWKGYWATKIVNQAALKLVQLLIESLIDSAAYAIAIQVSQLAIFNIGNAIRPIDNTGKQAIGFDPFNVGTNFAQLGKNFGANMVFDLSLGKTTALANKVPGLGNLPGNWGTRVANFGGRMMSSEIYSVVYNLEGGNVPWKGFGWQQQTDKLIFHGLRIFKNPDQGPVFSGRSRSDGTWPLSAWTPASPGSGP